jgi:hypothetical protein
MTPAATAVPPGFEAFFTVHSARTGRKWDGVAGGELRESAGLEAM